MVVECFACGEVDSEGNSTNPAKFLCLPSTNKFSLRHCLKCGAEFWWPMNNDAMPKTKWVLDKGKSVCFVLEGRHRAALDFLKKQGLVEKKLLDIGCRGGAFLKKAERLGIEGWGIDPESVIVEAARTVHGLKRLYSADLLGFCRDHPNEKFDIVTAFEIFEHVDNPREFLAIIAKLLKPGGYLIMSVPNFGRFGGYPTTNVAPIQWTRWTGETVRRFLKTGGFADVKVKFIESSPRQFFDFLHGLFRERTIPGEAAFVGSGRKLLTYPRRSRFDFKSVINAISFPLLRLINVTHGSQTIFVATRYLAGNL